MPLPLTQVQLDLIQARHDRRDYEDLLEFGDFVGDEVKADVQALLDEGERLNGLLTDCWLLLDRIARSYEPALAEVRGACAGLLRKQKAPGWK